MSGIARAVLTAAMLNCGLLGLAANAEEQGQWLKDGTCALFSADAHSGDTVSWTGSCIDGYAEGLGTATFTHDGQSQSFTANFVRGVIPDGHVISRWGQGWSYDGEAVDGRFQGAGILTTDTSDRFDGQWTNGKMSGFGVLLRANGERYAGDWKDDKPNGSGELRQTDGTFVKGVFVDGKLAGSETSVRTSGNVVAVSNVPFGGLSGKTLTAVDGSSIALTLIEGGMELQVVPAEGSPRKTTFTFMTDRMGTVVEDSGSQNAGSSVTGFFRLTGKGVEARYADGRSAMLSASTDGGVQMALESDGGPSCRAWYPQGHQFSDVDKRMALNAYASRLGLPIATSDAGNGCSSAPQAANAAPAIVPPPATPPAVAPGPRPERRSEAKTQARRAKASYRIGDYRPDTEPAVKNSEVHAIDAAQAAIPRSALQIGAVTPPDKSNASQCLKVDSDGSHWGFRNSCAFAVQFAYCMAGGSDGLAACGTNDTGITGAAGSVAANGFGALITDTSLQDKDAAHNFRWIACGGGSGEVVAHLDRFEPPAGRCERTRTASAN
ncbi:MAG: hypothetical protein ABI608_00920 [Rhizomicrobium sp.]